MEIVYKQCAGIDVHKKNVVVCRMSRDAQGKLTHQTRTFGTMTQNILELGDWLSEAGVTHVAMESTGEYWKPIYNLLEGSFELLLVNARHIKMVPGRKTDVVDAHWIADLLQHGLLRGSFVPPKDQRAMRDLTRHRSNFVRQRATVCNRIQKLLEGANIKLASVATDILGASGRQMLNAIACGEDDPKTLAAMAKGRLRDKDAALKLALEGRIQPHQRLLLRELLAQVVSLDHSIEVLTHSIEDLCRNDPRNGEGGNGEGGNGEGGNGEGGEDLNAKDLEETPGAVSEASPTSYQAVPSPSHLDSRKELETGAIDKTTAKPIKVSLPPLGFGQAVALLMTMPGVGRSAAEIILGEIGTNMYRFPSDRHLSSWAGVASGNNRSAGKILSGRTTYGNMALKILLIQVALAAVRTKKGYLYAFFRRIASRRGTKKALMAVAHAMLVSIYHMLKNHQSYNDLGADHFDSRNPEAVAKKLVKRIMTLGEEPAKLVVDALQRAGIQCAPPQIPHQALTQPISA